MWTGPSIVTPAGAGLAAPKRCAASAGPICFTHSQGAASGRKNGLKSARDSGSVK